MSTSYYIVRTEPTPLYGQVKVAKANGGKASLLTHCNEAAWVDADGNYEDFPRVTAPATVADLKALVASGRYRFVDEYGVDHGVEEVFG